MCFSYNKLFKLLIDRGLHKKTLRKMSGISTLRKITGMTRNLYAKVRCAT